MSDLSQDTKKRILEQLVDDEDETGDESDIDVKNNITIKFNNQGISQPDNWASFIQPQQPASLTAQQPASVPYNGTDV